VDKRQRLFGVETEYAITAMRDGAAIDREQALHAVMQCARRKLVHLPDLHSGGMFLENGARFYVDCGMHPEFSTPECLDPWSVVRYVQAGNCILGDLAQAVQSDRPPGTEVMCFRCNVDYDHGSGATWGSHESYMHRMDPACLQPQIVPHLVSRILYTGAGGFNPLSNGLEFTLSPRVAHFCRVSSGDSTGNRGIFHTKNESLCRDGYNRLHVICGESLCSETAMFLKVGTTALIVAMAEAGLNPGGDMQIDSPLDALRAFAADPTCKKAVRMKDGRKLTAIEIQRHYLQAAEDHTRDERLPAWAGDVCRTWRDILDRLGQDPRTTDRALDWSMKLSLYADQAVKLGIRWERLSLWNEIINRLKTALAQANCGEEQTTLDLVTGPQSPIPNDANRLTRFLHSKGVDWNELRHLLAARQRLFEIDTRFGQLGPRGIFESLDSAGVLDHRVSGVGNVESALSEPPSAGRARIRGQVVRRLAAERSSWCCDWHCIINPVQGRMLDLGNPFADEESWTQCADLEAGMFDNRLRLLSCLEALHRRT
jgi:proteasome accessory factor A